MGQQDTMTMQTHLRDPAFFREQLKQSNKEEKVAQTKEQCDSFICFWIKLNKSETGAVFFSFFCTKSAIFCHYISFP